MRNEQKLTTFSEPLSSGIFLAEGGFTLPFTANYILPHIEPALTIEKRQEKD